MIEITSNKGKYPEDHIIEKTSKEEIGFNNKTIMIDTIMTIRITALTVIKISPFIKIKAKVKTKTKLILKIKVSLKEKN